jgi:hypothetical protein
MILLFIFYHILNYLLPIQIPEIFHFPNGLIHAVLYISNAMDNHHHIKIRTWNNTILIFHFTGNAITNLGITTYKNKIF